ncbi:MAG: type II toxin-antitoxin system Phd/YefM family antitoxin [Stellaceae bacterium]
MKSQGRKLRCIVAANPEIGEADYYAAVADIPLKDSSKRSYLNDTRRSIAALEKAGWQRPGTAEPRATDFAVTNENIPESQRLKLLCLLALDPDIGEVDLCAAMKAAGISLEWSTVQNARYDIRETIAALEKTGWQPSGTAEPGRVESEEAVEAVSQLKEVGAFEAKTRLGQLLDLVERGEEVVITRHGRPVALLAPPKAAFNRTEARAAAERIREMSKGVTLGGLSLKDLIDEGRL